jgi:hypothetical protein
MAKRGPALLGAATVALVAACGGDDGTGVLPVSAEVSLAPAEYTLLSGSRIAGSVRFPAAGASGAQYLVVGQSTTSEPDQSASFALRGRETASTTQAAVQASRVPRPPDIARRFHATLRRREAEMVGALRREVSGPGGAGTGAAPGAPPPVVGEQRTFKVCADLQCDSLTNVVATARYVGAEAAIYVDDAAPSGGFTDTDLNQLGSQFDTELYPLEVAAFGSESDIDANGVVIILLTKVLNELVPEPDCDNSFIAGFFFGGDLAPGFSTQYNNGEVFYGFVPDPSGQVSCAYSTPIVKRIIPTTFVHEFQHMIAFNQRFLLRNASQLEALWLSEGIATLAEELAGLHYDSLNIDTTATRFLIGNVYNQYLYLKDPTANAVVSEASPLELEQYGSAWSLVRYLTDQFGSDVPRRLTQTTATGASNIRTVTGTGFDTLLGRWALTHYVSDLAGFTAPAELKFDFWRFRTTYASLNSQDPQNFDRPFPLVPLPATAPSLQTSGTLRSGASAYVLVTQAASDPGFDLTFLGPNGNSLPSNVGAQLAIIRIR